MPTSYFNFKKYIGARILYFIESRRNQADQEKYIKIKISLSSYYFRKNKKYFKDFPFYYSHNDNFIVFKAEMKSFSYKNIPWAEASEAYIVSCPYGKYVLKKVSNTSHATMVTQDKLLSFFGSKILPRLIYWKELYNNQYLQIFAFNRGLHKFGELSGREKLLIISAAKKFFKIAEKCPNMNARYLHDLINKHYKKLPDRTYLKVIGKKFLSEKMIFQEKQYISHYDLHRQNFLLRNKSVVFLDAESIMYAPKDFQAAALFMSCFLLYQRNESFNLKELIDIWGDNFDENRLFMFMLIRAWIGAAFFQHRVNKNIASENDIKLSNLYLDKVKFLLKSCNYAEL